LKLWIDIYDLAEPPSAGWYVQAIGRTGKRNSAYCVRAARWMKRRIKTPIPRVLLDVEHVDKIPSGARIFEFRWYPRNKTRKLTFEEQMSRQLRRIHASPEAQR
jgi:hypothetical protein